MTRANTGHAAIHRLAASEIREAFDKYDEDGSGMMDKEELVSALGDLGMFVTAAQADVVLRKFGGGASELNREQFNLLVDELRQVQANLTPRSAAKMSGGKPGLCSCLPIWRYHEVALQVYTNKWMQSASSPIHSTARRLIRAARTARNAVIWPLRFSAPNRALWSLPPFPFRRTSGHPNLAMRPSPLLAFRRCPPPSQCLWPS